MHLRKKLVAGLVLVPLVGSSALARNGSNHDAFLASTEDKALAATVDALQARGLRVEHQEERLGVPSFLWATREDTGNKALASLTPEQAARAHLRAVADVYRLSSEEVEGAELRNLHRTDRGPIIARFGQSVDGIEVFRNELKVVMNRDQGLVAVSGYLAPAQAVDKARGTSSRAFQLDAREAIARAFQELSGLALGPGSLVSTGKVNGDYVHFTFEPGARNLLTWNLAEPARAKKVYFTLPDRLEPAWYVEVNAGAKDSSESSHSSFVVSATSGELLFSNDLRAHDSYTYRVWADPATLLPHDGPQGTDATPHPTGMPDRYQAPFVPPSLVTLRNYPFSRNDPWLPANATQTVGNNVDAYVDLAAPDGFQPEADLRAPVTAAGTFDHTFDTALAPDANDTQRLAAVVNLFYINNFLHDWYYDAGFDEASGNAQALNYGRGGLEGDSLKVEAQDYGSRNNANMSTPADGARPRMQMYIFDGLPLLRVTAPAALAGLQDTNSAAFGAATFDLSGDVQIPDPAGSTTGCTAFPADAFSGKIALIDRGGCNFTVKALNAQDAGAIGVIIANNAASQPAPGLGGSDANVTLPVLSITKETADAWKAEVAANASTLTVEMERGPDLDRDGTLDNDIIAHEWGHYISNRLVGNANGLNNNQGRSMGEGWADFHALLLNVRESDRARPGNDQWQGVYALATYTQSGGNNQGYYYGIRRVPYSTDFARNALTFKHIANGVPLPDTHPVASGQTGRGNSEVHNAGEVWATMLWECYASLLNAYPFQEAQDRMKQYLVAAYKATPSSPTLLEARDALLAVAAASDPADHSRFLKAFARRGAGLGARGPERDSQDHIGVVESFERGNNLEVVSLRLDDGLVGCDQDGVLDVGETGSLQVTVRNTGASTLAAFSGTVSSSSTTATLEFPGGTTLSFPSLPPHATATRTLAVRLASVSDPAPRAGLTLTFDEPSLPASAQTAAYDPRIHYDEVLGTSATEDVEGGQTTAWTSTLMNRGEAAWTKQGGTGNGFFHAPNLPATADLTLTSPWMEVNPTGEFIVSFKHRWSFEASNGGGAPFWDGGVVELSIDGIEWLDVLELGHLPGYSDYLDDRSDNPLAGRPALVGLSPDYPAWRTETLNFGEVLAGYKVQFRFRLGSDGAVGAYGWDIDDISFTNVKNSPFGGLAPESSDGTVCNRRPVAHAGTNQSVKEGKLLASGALERTPITLDGSGSFDPDGQALSYTWTQVGGPAVTLSATDVARPTFVADVAWDSVLSFQLVTSDGQESSLPKRVDVAVQNVNRLPKAVPQAPASVVERSTERVTLDGSSSTDEDGETLTYKWTQVEGPSVLLDNPASATPSFALPEVVTDTQLTFSLVVNDGLQDSTPATLAVTVLNQDRAPVAHAGEAQDVAARSTVTLQGSASDPDGDVPTYTWSQVSGPEVVLTGADTAAPSFTAPDVRTSEPAELVFQLVASAKGLASEPSPMTVTVRKANRHPVAQGPNDMEVEERTVLTLDATGSDPDDDTLTWLWEQTGGPLVTLTGADTASLSFTAPEVLGDTLLTFRLLATDSDGARSEAVTVRLTVKDVNRAPVAKARKIAGGTAGQSVTLDASGSTDPDGDALTYQWKQVSGPSVTLSPTSGSFTSFTAPDEAATLVFELSVDDGRGGFASEQVEVKLEKAAGGCSSTGSGPGSLAPLLLLGAGLLVSRRRSVRG